MTWHQPPPPGQPHGWVQLRLAAWHSVHRAKVDGHRVPIQGLWTTIAVAPGRHEVEVWYVNRSGIYQPKQLLVDVLPGQVVPVYYAMPRHILGKASLGFTPQPRSWALSGRELLEGCVVPIVFFFLLATGIAVWELVTG